jgi:peptide deformylase
MKIVEFPDPILLKKCSPVTVFGPELEILLEAMWETMVKAPGRGLAANQVSLDLHAFVMQTANKEKIFVVNPEIVSRSAWSANLKEGCLSAPKEVFVLKERSDWVKLSFQDHKGRKHLRIFTGIDSVCAQHEFDHIEGRSFLQSPSIPASKRETIRKKWGI